MPLDEFLNTYKEKDIYLVTSIPKIMRGNVIVVL